MSLATMDYPMKCVRGTHATSLSWYSTWYLFGTWHLVTVYPHYTKPFKFPSKWGWHLFKGGIYLYHLSSHDRTSEWCDMVLLHLCSHPTLRVLASPGYLHGNGITRMPPGNHSSLHIPTDWSFMSMWKAQASQQLRASSPPWHFIWGV